MIRIDFAVRWLCCVALVAWTTAHAQEDDEFVVTAARLPTALERSASRFHVITRNEIERFQYVSLADALQAVPSLSVVRNGGPGKLTSVFSRGTNANHTLVILDGIELNDPSNPDGRVDVAQLLLGNIERIEVLHGPQGTLHGSDAVGAVIHLVSRADADQALTVEAGLEVGSFDTMSETVSARGARGALQYRLALQHQDTDGISALSEDFAAPDGRLDDDGYENLTWSGGLGWRLSPLSRLDLSARYVRSDNDLDLNVFPVRDDRDSRSADRQWLYSGRYTYDSADGRFSHQFGLSYNRLERRTWDDPDPVNPDDRVRDFNTGRRFKADTQHTWYASERHTLIGGVEYERESAQLDFRSTSAFGAFDQSASETTEHTAAFLQDRYDFSERLFGELGGRLDHYQGVGSKFTYRAAASYRIPRWDMRVRANVASGFKAPTIFQRYGSSASSFGVFQGNPDLEPETSRGWELGVEWGSRDSIGGSVSYFRNEIQDLIVFTPDFLSNENRGEVRTWGVEVSAYANVSASFSLAADYSYVRTRDRDTGEALLRRPQHKATLQGRWMPQTRFTLSPEIVYVGQRLDTDPISFTQVRAEDYWLVRLAGSWQFAEDWRFDGRVENALDRDFEEPLGFAQPGRAYYLGVRGSF